MLTVGSVVKSMAGHDKDRFYTVLEVEQDSVLIADGKARRLEQPKRKNVKHIQVTNTVLEPGAAETNKKLRAALRPFNGEPQTGSDRYEGGNELCQKRM